MRLLLADLSIESVITADAGVAQLELCRRKFDAIFADCDRDDGANLLRLIKRSKHNTRAVVFGFTSSEKDATRAFELGAHFAIDKPLVVAKVKRTLKAAHGMMMREQRIHYRHPAAAYVTVKSDALSVKTASMCDLSQNGALLQTATGCRKGQYLRLRFVLPETRFVIETPARVTWSDLTGRVGVKFVDIPEPISRELNKWVIERSMKVELTDADRAGVKVVNPAVDLNDSKYEAPLGIEFEIIEPQQAQQPVKAPISVSAPQLSQYAPLKVLSFTQSKPVISHGKCVQLNEREIAAELDEEFRVNDAVLVSLTLPDQSTTILHAHIRRQEGLCYGLEFVSLPEQVRALLSGNSSYLAGD
jgi:CheY-like chemotaxis protein/c-di-GMP-binding flagellar brake protein YcgR